MMLYRGGEAALACPRVLASARVRARVRARLRGIKEAADCLLGTGWRRGR